jgi:hypothetical protein
MDGQTITWVQILQVGGFAGVVSALFAALFGGGVKEFFEWHERKRKARYLALKLSLVLEDYYYACRDRIYSINNYSGSNGNAGSNDVGLPKISTYPEDPVAWIYIDQAIADEVLSLPASIQLIDEGISFNAYMDHVPDGTDPVWTLEPLYEMAFRSIDLARRIRLKNGLPELDRTRTSEDSLREYQKKILIELKNREERARMKMPSI